MTDERMRQTEAQDELESCPQAPSGQLRWWLAILVAAVVSLPLAVVLSWAAMLPFMLGAFFFMLFGLLVGAVVFRIAGPGRPYGAVTVFTGTTFLVFVCGGGALVKEAADFPYDMAHQATGKTRSIGAFTLAEFREEVARQVRAYLRDQYPPGGTLGYVRWIVTKGVLEKGAIEAVDAELSPVQRCGWWSIRLVLTIGLLALGIGSQTLLLQKPERVTKDDPPAESPDSADKPGGQQDAKAAAEPREA